MQREKWTTEEMERFLKFFKERPCLWDPAADGYGKSERRTEAILWIIRQLGVRLNEMEIKHKIKSIRNTYLQSLKKVLRSEELGLGEVFLPTLPWFAAADSFWRESTVRGLNENEQKKSEQLTRHETSSDSNDQECCFKLKNEPLPARRSGRLENSFARYDQDLQVSDCDADIAAAESEKRNHTIASTANEDSHIKNGPSKNSSDSSPGKKKAIEPTVSEEDEFELQKSNNSTQRFSRTHLETLSILGNHSEDFVHQEADRRTRNEVFHRDPEASHSKRKRLGHSPSQECSQEGDEFDTFSTHLGNQLRHLPLERALRCQDAIHSLLMKERIEHCQELTRTRTGSVEKKMVPQTEPHLCI